jgi:3-phenylpropionate/cinnamic acid dioxygenase small subunit
MGLTSDEQAIANLLFRYARLMDAGDFEGVAELFARGSYFGARGDGITKMLAATVILHDGKMGTKHVTTNLEIEQSDENTAVVRSYFTVFQQLPTLPMQPVIAGRYTDQVAKDADGWYFVDRVAELDLIGDLSQHVKYTP